MDDGFWGHAVDSLYKYCELALSSIIPISAHSAPVTTGHTQEIGRDKQRSRARVRQTNGDNVDRILNGTYFDNKEKWPMIYILYCIFCIMSAELNIPYSQCLRSFLSSGHLDHLGHWGNWGHQGHRCLPINLLSCHFNMPTNGQTDEQH